MQLLQIIYRLYPTHAVDIHENKKEEIEALCNSDAFIKRIYENIEYS